MAEIYDIRTRQYQTKEELDNRKKEIFNLFLSAMDVIGGEECEIVQEVALSKLKELCNLMLKYKNPLDHLEELYFEDLHKESSESEVQEE